VVVQTDETYTENNFLLDIAEKYNYIKAIIGWVDLLDPKSEIKMIDLKSTPLIVGFRTIMQGSPDEKYLDNKLFFENNSDKLKVASLVQLDILATILTRYESANLEIQGHTDNVGDDAKNMTLSQNRTETVKAYLVKKGISENRITATGFGETKPIADNRTPLGKAKNRRVELKASY
jgi:outer membrane protein OmpA-like peptidoglycan-associated protein